MLSFDSVTNPIYYIIINAVVTTQVNSLQTSCPGDVMPNIVDYLSWQASLLQIKVN